MWSRKLCWQISNFIPNVTTISILLRCLPSQSIGCGRLWRSRHRRRSRLPLERKWSDWVNITRYRKMLQQNGCIWTGLLGHWWKAGLIEEHLDWLASVTVFFQSWTRNWKAKQTACSRYFPDTRKLAGKTQCQKNQRPTHVLMSKVPSGCSLDWNGHSVNFPTFPFKPIGMQDEAKQTEHTCHTCASKSVLASVFWNLWFEHRHTLNRSWWTKSCTSQVVTSCPDFVWQ